MIKKLLVALVIIFSTLEGIAQQLPIFDCGIVYVHDASGNRTKRVYFSNNTVDPYPQGAVPVADTHKNLFSYKFKRAF